LSLFIVAHVPELAGSIAYYLLFIPMLVVLKTRQTQRNNPHKKIEAAVATGTKE
jgi:hypothetical protein